MEILFVCTGNICRSPTTDVVFRALVEAEGLGAQIDADSVGTHGYHIGARARSQPLTSPAST